MNRNIKIILGILALIAAIGAFSMLSGKDDTPADAEVSAPSQSVIEEEEEEENASSETSEPEAPESSAPAETEPEDETEAESSEVPEASAEPEVSPEPPAPAEPVSPPPAEQKPEEEKPSEPEYDDEDDYYDDDDDDYDSHDCSYTTEVEGSNTATCTDAGKKTMKCSCGATTQVATESLGHDFVEGVCSRCNVTGAKVYTAEELKTFLNDFTDAGSDNNTIEIEHNIILSGDWTPVVVDGYNGAGVITVNGNGHTISGLNDTLFSGGFAGESGIVVNDLTIENANITSSNSQGYGAFINCIDSMPRIELNNCHLKNSTITDTLGARVGGLIGWSAGYNDPNNGPVDTYITITNCSVTGCTITANGSVGAIIGHAGNNPATYHTITNCTVKNNVLTSTDDGGWRVGVVVGTANVGEVTISGTVSEGNTLAQTGKTAPEGQSDLYGRFVPNSTGKLTIEGVGIGVVVASEVNETASEETATEKTTSEEPTSEEPTSEEPTSEESTSEETTSEETSTEETSSEAGAEETSSEDETSEETAA